MNKQNLYRIVRTGKEPRTMQVTINLWHALGSYERVRMGLLFMPTRSPTRTAESVRLRKIFSQLSDALFAVSWIFTRHRFFAQDLLQRIDIDTRASIYLSFCWHDKIEIHHAILPKSTVLLTFSSKYQKKVLSFF